MQSSGLTKILLGLSLTVAIAMVAVASYAAWPTRHHADPAVLRRPDSHVFGTGKVQLVEFGDFECDPCRVAESWVEQARRDYNGRVTFVFRNYPLQSLHPNAQLAAEAAEAAGAQGKYWPMHDKLYADQTAWDGLAEPTNTFVGYAAYVGVTDIAKFKADLATNAFAGRVDADTADALSLGLNATPTFYVNGVRQTHLTSYAGLKQALDAAIKN